MRRVLLWVSVVLLLLSAFAGPHQRRSAGEPAPAASAPSVAPHEGPGDRDAQPVPTLGVGACDATLPQEPAEAEITIITDGHEEQWKGLEVDGLFYRLINPCWNGKHRTIQPNGRYELMPGYGIDVYGSRYYTRVGPDAVIIPSVRVIDQTWVYMPVYSLENRLQFDEATRTLRVDRIDRRLRPLPEEIPPQVRAYAERSDQGMRSYWEETPIGMLYWVFGNPGSGLRFVDTFNDQAIGPVIKIDPAGSEVLVGVRPTQEWYGTFLLQLPGEAQTRHLGLFYFDQRSYDQERTGMVVPGLDRTEPGAVVDYWRSSLGIPGGTKITYLIEGDRAEGRFEAAGRPWVVHLRREQMGWLLTEVTWG